MYMYFAFCRLNTFSPLATTAVFGSYLSSLYSYPSLYRRCRFTYQNDGIGFVGPKKKTSVGLLVFNPLWFPQVLSFAIHVFKKLRNIRISLLVAGFAGIAMKTQIFVELCLYGRIY